MPLQEILFLLLTYLWGSVPAGYLLTRHFVGKNILELGSGNVGSTNVKRAAGIKLATITQLLDMLKGLLPVFLYSSTGFEAQTTYYIYMLALAAIIGHDFSIFLRFKGGKGVNTTLGASVLLAPFPVFISVGIYFIMKWRFKYVSVGSLALAISMPLIEFIFNQLTPSFYYLIICSVLIILLHHQNIKRLIKGTELSA